MKIFGDLKFIVTIVVAIVGVIVPVWLWQADISSKSLLITLKTRVPLQPTEKESLQGMEFSVDGKRIENPYLVVLEIANNGSKPILAGDFEAPLDFRLESDTYFVRSRITNKMPKDIDTDISTEKTKISFKPALLNPKDSVAVTIITSGAAPIFETKARVAGISSISITDNTIKKPNTAKLIFLGVIALLLSIASAIASDGAIKDGVFLRQRAAAYIAFVSLLSSVAILIRFLEELVISDFWHTMLYYTIMTFPAVLIASGLNRKPKNVASGNSP